MVGILWHRFNIYEEQIKQHLTIIQSIFFINQFINKPSRL